VSRVLKLLPHQYNLLKDKQTKILGLVSGFGAGKTFAVARKAIDLAVENAGYDGIVTEPNFPLLNQILIPEIKQGLEDFGIPYEFKAADSIFYCNINGKSTRIICKSMEGYERLIGINAAWVIMDEFDTAKPSLAYNAYIKLLGRIRVGNVRQMVIVSTPEGYRAMYKIFIEEADSDKKLIRAKTTDNYHLPQDYIDTMKSQYPSELIEAYINGEFTNLTSGTVYTQYDRTLNDTATIDEGIGDIHIGIDFNVGAMSAIACVVRDQKVYAVDEYIGLFDTPELIQTIESKYLNRKVFVYPDAAGNARKSVNANESDIKLLRQAGFYVRANSKNPSIMDRVNGLNNLFNNANGDRRCFINTIKCTELTKALEQQAYDEQTKMPDKKSGHDNNGIDALGYLTSFLFPLKYTRANNNTRQQQNNNQVNWGDLYD
jgi:PBSX family phage terminase large subunit